MRQTPAEYVIDRFGGVCKLARLLGMAPSTVGRWRKAPGGRIPRGVVQERILDVAVARGIQVDPGALVVGLTIEAGK